MSLALFILFCSVIFTAARRFNGGTIRWAPIDPYDNSTPVDVTIIQSYSWTYPYIKCANNVPVSTSGWGSANTNLTCAVDCSTDGGYSNAPIDILTDCTSTSSSLKMMTSERSKNITLSSDAHFYLAYRGSAWVALNDPAEAVLDWSIVTYIDLRKRPDGFINTSPVAKVVSPQYAIVNKTTQINILVSDANVGDDVRCRWSTYTTGYRRRKRSDEEGHENHHYTAKKYKKESDNKEIMDIRKKRSSCLSECLKGDKCTSARCMWTMCVGTLCESTCCDYAMITTTSTSTDSTTSTETPGTPKSTSSFPIRQAVDEYGDICYPNSVPNGTALSNCTITFTGLKAGVWYGIAVQVEDFIDGTSTIPMSSVPVQFLIYVQSQPVCSKQPIIFPINRCLEVQIGVSISFNLSAINLCNPSVAKLADIVVSSGITGMTGGNLTNLSTNSSISYIKFTWTPQTNQVGLQQLCTIAYTTENLQSDQYCITFTVKNSSDICVTTTTSTSTTTSSLSQIFTTESLNDFSLVLGLSFGLGIPLLLVLSILATCLCCRWCPGHLWKKFRQRFWKDEHVHCEVCERQHNGYSSDNTGKKSDKDLKNYRHQYINDRQQTSMTDSFREQSFLSNSPSPFDVRSLTTTRTTFMSWSSINVMPNEDISSQVSRPVQQSFLKSGGSILVRAYVAQEQTKHNFSH